MNKKETSMALCSKQEKYDLTQKNVDPQPYCTVFSLLHNFTYSSTILSTTL